MFRIENGFFADDYNMKTRKIELSSGVFDDEWMKKQENSLGEYEITHKKGEVDETTRMLFALFNKYIAYHIYRLGRPVAIIDVGCGAYPAIPPYMGDLSEKNLYVGLDPIPTRYDREYLFVNGRLEDCEGALVRSQFDLAIFCTSLDHCENLAHVARVTRYLLKKDGYVLFFTGLHDTELVARQTGASNYGTVFSSLYVRHFLIQWMKASLFKLPLNYSIFRRRQMSLDRKLPLDTLHFHYFTRKSFCEQIGRYFGPMEDITFVPNTNVAFAACRMEG